MLKKISNIPFSGTPEQEAALKAVIAECKGDKSLLMHVMQKAQEIYDYLPIEVQTMIAEGMDVPLQKVYGVSTFYAQFALSPKGRYNISVCLGTACYVKGSDKVLEKISEEIGIEPGECTEDAKFSLEACRCIGACGLAPVMTVNDDVYGRLTPEEIPEILRSFSCSGVPLKGSLLIFFCILCFPPFYYRNIRTVLSVQVGKTVPPHLKPYISDYITLIFIRLYFNKEKIAVFVKKQTKSFVFFFSFFPLCTVFDFFCLFSCKNRKINVYSIRK